MMDLVERKRLSRDLSGAAASVLLALVMANRPLTAVDLAADWVNQSEPTVTAGLNRLAEYGLAQNWGKFEGWTVNFDQLRLWQGHSGVFLSEKATSNQSGSSVASPLKATHQSGSSVALPNPTNEQPVDNFPVSDDEKTENLGFLPAPDYEKTKNLGFLSHTHVRSDQIRSDLNQSTSDFDFKNKSDLISLIEFFAIEPPNSERLVTKPADATLLYGWLLWANCQAWVNTPNGWAIKATLNPTRPLDHNWRQLAAWLLSLSDDQRAAMDYEFNGLPALNAFDIESAVYRAVQQEIDEAHAGLIFQIKKQGHESALWRIS